MSKKYPWAKWTLPEVIDPPRVCYTIPVPDDPMHKAAFRGALLALASATKWQDDTDHTAKDVALVWREIYDLVVECEECATSITESWDEDLTSMCEALRWQNGKLQALCCGTWTDITGQPAQGFQAGALGNGSGVPAPGGGCQTYNMQLNAQGIAFLPYQVNTGDTILIANARGASYNSANGNWYCPDGSQFVLGACTPYTTTNGSNPMPAVVSGRLIAKIGATFYDVQAGSPFTVPAGVTGQPVNFQVNYPTLSSSSGNLTFDVQVCNNATATWTHVYDFRTSPYSSIFSIVTTGDNPPAPAGVYVNGVGYQTGLIKFSGTNAWYREINLLCNKAFTLTQWQSEFTFTGGTYAGNTADPTYRLRKNGATNQVAVLMPTAPTTPQVYNNAGEAVTQELLTMNCGFGSGVDGGGQITLTKITISGKGTDPF